MWDLFEKEMTNGRHSAHSGHRLPVLKHSASSLVIVAVTFVTALCLGIPWAHSTQEPSEKGSNETISSEITPGAVESKIEDTKKRIKISEGAENEHTAQQLGVSLFDLQARTGKLREIMAIYQRLLTGIRKQATLDKEETLLREADIVVAFPQRDIHVDTKGPLEFKMLDSNSRPIEARGD